MTSILKEFFNQRKNNKRPGNIKYMNQPPADEDIMTAHMIAQGMVQGVGFRYLTKMLADERNIKGTVKNLENGDVEIQASASFENLSEFIHELSLGPSPAAQVDELTVKFTDNDTPPDSFDVVY